MENEKEQDVQRIFKGVQPSLQ